MELLLLGAVALLILAARPGGLTLTTSSADVPRTLPPYPMPPAYPSGAPVAGSYQTIFGTNAPVAEKITAGLANIIDAARATDTGAGDPT